MATVRYWNANYWNANYWNSTYWSTSSGGERIGQIAASTTLGGPGGTSGQYWNANYWNSAYWEANYWKLTSSEGGTTFTGTFDAPTGRTGQIGATTTYTADFDGGVGQVQLFDLEVSFSARWTFTQTSTFSGSIANTLDNATSDIDGIFSADFFGSADVTLEDNASNLDGTHTAPANRAGVVSTSTQNVLPSLNGIYLEGVIGTIQPTLQDDTGALSGTYFASDTDGALGTTLEDSPAQWVGGSFAAGDIVGAINSGIDAMALSAFGSHVFIFGEVNLTNEPVDSEDTEEPIDTNEFTQEAA